jgi:hypothetical protein
MKFRKLIGAQTPAYFRVTRERSGAGARRVDENVIKLPAERKLASGIKFNNLNAFETEPRELIPHCPETMRVTVCRDYQSISTGPADERRSLTTRSGT